MNYRDVEVYSELERGTSRGGVCIVRRITLHVASTRRVLITLA